MDHTDIAEIAELIAELDDEAAVVVQECLDAGLDPISILKEGVVKGLEKIGQLFEAKEYFLAELMVGGELAETCIKIIDPHLPATGEGDRQGAICAARKDRSAGIGLLEVARRGDAADVKRNSG